MHFSYKATLPSVLMPKSGDLESHAPFGGILKAKRNFEIVSERAMFEPSQGLVGGGGWWVVHGSEAVFGMLVFAVFPWAEICPFA